MQALENYDNALVKILLFKKQKKLIPNLFLQN